LRPKEKAAPKGRLKFEVLPINAQGRGLVHRAREASSAPHFAVARYPALPARSADGTQIPASVAQPVSRGSAHSGRFIKSPIPHLRHVAAGFRGVECPGFSQTKDTFTMKYGLLFGCAAIALMAVPVAASGACSGSSTTRSPSPTAKNIARSGRRRTCGITITAGTTTTTEASATDACKARPDAPGGPYVI